MKQEKIKLICFDLDKTLIEENMWYNLNIALGVTPEEDAILLKKYTEGMINYFQWTNFLLNIYKKRGKANFYNITNTIFNFTYKKGAEKIVQYFKKSGYQLVLISGSIDILVNKIAKDLGIKYAIANNIFLFNKKKELIDIATHKNDSSAKLYHLEKICKKLNIKIIECVCIGDGDNDIKMFLKTKHGITFKGTELEYIAWKTIDNLLDLKKIIF